MAARNPLMLVIVAAAVACGGDAVEDQAPGAEMEAGAADAPERAVRIVQPSEGDTVPGPDVRVVLDARGFTVTTAGDTTPNSGHHHLFLNADLSEAGSPHPAEENRIVHMGDGSTEYTFEGVEPGEHRLITAVGDAFHVPVQPWLVDTVTFVVGERAGSP